MYHIFFVHFSIDGLLGCFHVLKIVKCYSEIYWGVCILLDHVFLWIYAQEWGCMVIY